MFGIEHVTLLINDTFKALELYYLLITNLPAKFNESSVVSIN